MSAFCSSTSTASNHVSKVASRQVLPFLYPAEISQSSCSRPRRAIRPQAPLQMVSATTSGLEAWFIKSLAGASHCQKHSPKTFQASKFFSSQGVDAYVQRRRTHNIASQQQQTKQAKGPARGLGEVQKLTKQELLDLVDQYDGESYTDRLPLLDLPSLFQSSDGRRNTVSDKPEDEWPPPNYTWPADAETKVKLAELETVVEQKALATNPEDLYQLYRALPNPRAPYLPAKLRHKFLRHLYTVEQKNETYMLRYLSVVDDLKKAAIPLTTIEWNNAISFAARYVNRSTEIEVEAALHMFREMEHSADIKGNGVTFNILYDVACKAGKFTLADMIYKEMEFRGIEFDRFHYVSLIHYHGLRRDGDGARTVYRNLVESGEIVDTVILNAMISALIQCYEPHAAENIYERMKRIHMGRGPNAPHPPRNFLAQRKVTRTLKRMAQISKYDVNKREQYQSKSIVAPDLHTYRILVNYFAITAGELNQTARLLEEMKVFNVPIHGALFLALFKGFSIHGGIRYTHWTEARLESVWKSYLQALENRVANLYISQWMAVWALRAFAKCVGKARTAAVWAEIKTKWKPSDMELDFVLSSLRPLMEGPDSADKKTDWLLGPL